MSNSKITHYTIVNEQGNVEVKLSVSDKVNFPFATEEARKLVKGDKKPRWVVSHSDETPVNAREIRMADTGTGRTTSTQCGVHRLPRKR